MSRRPWTADSFITQASLYNTLYNRSCSSTSQTPSKAEIARGRSLHKFSEDTCKLLDEALFYDVEIKCGEEDFKAHRNMLSTRSQVFFKMFQNDTLERRTGKVEIKAMDSDIFKLFLRYLYSGLLPELTSGNAVDLYEAGDRYEVLELREYCADFLIEKLTPERSFDMLILADAHGDEYFKNGIIVYMGNRKVPLNDDLWQDFCDSQPKLAIEASSRSRETAVSKSDAAAPPLTPPPAEMKASLLYLQLRALQRES